MTAPVKLVVILPVNVPDKVCECVCPVPDPAEQNLSIFTTLVVPPFPEPGPPTLHGQSLE